ncbi:MAG: cobalamin-binding protein [Gemmatimonadetes bacterium]|nr:cobalamin-binding protein [Gemmatimonadota bacterium]
MVGGAAPSPRVVSLIASSTEIVCALGFEHLLIGRSHECDYPESVKRLPCCTDPKFVTDGTSYDIDQRVKAILEQGLSVYRVDAERLRALGPDVILTQSHCEVCAVSLRDVEAAVWEWLGARPRIVSLEPNSLEDVWNDVRRVADALGAPARGDALVSRLTARMAAVAERARALPSKPRVACIEWIDPLMAAGNWMPELVEMAGGVSLFGEAGKHSPGMTREELEARDPDIIVVLPCGFDLERTRREMIGLRERPDWRELRAMRGGRIYIADGNQYFNRPGPRLVESLEILAEIVHPDVFRFGHHGVGWERFA